MRPLPLFIASTTSVGIPGIDDGRKLLRQFDVPGTASYRGISASVSPGKLSSNRNDEDHHSGISLLSPAVLHHSHAPFLIEKRQSVYPARAYGWINKRLTPFDDIQ